MKTAGNPALLLIITMVVTLLPMILGLCTWSKLPETIAIHFGLDGTPNGWAPKWIVVFLIPLVMAAVQLVIHFSLAGPVSKGVVSSLVYSVSMLVVPLCAIICAIAIYGKALK